MVEKGLFEQQVYDCFSKFKEAIDNSLKKTVNGENKKELETFLNLKFQLYDNAFYEQS